MSLDAVKGLFSKPSRLPVIGIDIGTSAVKAVVMKSAGTAMEIKDWAVERIEGGDAKAALSKVCSRLESEGPIPVTSVSGKGTLIRYLDMPRMPLEDLRKSFVYEMDKYFPFDPQSIYTDCFILDQKSKDKRMPVLVAAVKKEIVEERLKLFQDVGIDLAQITLNSIAIANAFERLGPPMEKTENAKAILDVGGAVSNLLVLKDKSPRFTRDIFIGSHEMTQQIANTLGVDMAQAEALKCTPGDRNAEVMEACEAAVSQLVSELRLSLDYFMTEKNIQVDEFFLMGGGSLLKGIEQVFEKNLGMSVKTWDPLTGLNLSSTLITSGIREHSSQLGVAIGLACRGN